MTVLARAVLRSGCSPAFAEQTAPPESILIGNNSSPSWQGVRLAGMEIRKILYGF